MNRRMRDRTSGGVGGRGRDAPSYLISCILRGMKQRVSGIARESADQYAKSVFEAQEKRWGAPLLTNLVYARRPTIFRAVRGMWSGIDASGLIAPALRALINRRVASHNRCAF
jgi:hypothetical protein